MTVFFLVSIALLLILFGMGWGWVLSYAWAFENAMSKLPKLYHPTGPFTTLAQYQAASYAFAQYPDRGNNLTYAALGLTGEAGETADKVKKIIRDKDGIVNEQDREQLIKEVGDILWYVSAAAYELDTSLEEIATVNIAKLQDRQARNKIKGEGDNR